MIEPATIAVSIGFSVFSPAHVDVLVGDEVRWTNASIRQHTVTAHDGSFDSGRLAVGDAYARRFAVRGPVPYYCRLHPIPGTVEAHPLLLDDPGAPGGPGRVRTLRGRAALAPGAPVTLEADGAPVASAQVDGHGHLRFDVAPARTTTYRLVSGADASPPRTVTVLDRRVSATATRGRRRTVVHARVTPAAPGVAAVLQLRVPERFGWWPVARAKVDGSSRVRFSIPAGRRLPARVVLVARDGATVLAASRTLTVGRGRPVRQPRHNAGDHAGH